MTNTLRKNERDGFERKDSATLQLWQHKVWGSNTQRGEELFSTLYNIPAGSLGQTMAA
ncbi:MAG: hypothetical protein KDA89_07065 [Planctomycetaceae bacterium]|nr:hypothetical protein [Planctomycetaceae bacterium]